VPADRPDSPAEALIRVFQSETDEIRSAPEPISARITLFVLAALFVSLVGLSLLFDVDRMVTSEYGEVVTTEPTVVLQALDPSIIKTIDVAEGDRVKAGQLLTTLDPTFAAADVRALRLQIVSLDAQIARDTAELAGQPFDIPADPDPDSAPYLRLQKAYYDQRKAQFQAQVHGFDEQIAQGQATIARLRADEARYRDRIAVAQSVENMRSDLAADKVGSRLNLLIATDQRLEIQRNMEVDQGTMAETAHQLSAAAYNREGFIQQWLGQASQELVTARNQRDNAVEQLAKAEKHQSLVRLTAPDDAVVLSMAKLSVGSVLKEGDPFITLAMLRSPMEAEAFIDPRDIGFVRPGDKVTIKFDAFQFVEHGTAEGEVVWISDGTFPGGPSAGTVPTAGGALSASTSPSAGGNATSSYYKLHIRFTKVQLRNVPPTFRLIPGMTLAADIHLGKRSLFMYLVRGFVRGFDEAMREP
jgi:HlyD family secretion protein